MGKKDVRVDAYIAKSADYAKPVLKELRRRVHAAVPDAVETIKWSAPFFEYEGRPLAGMAAFKQYCSFGFWHPEMRKNEKTDNAMVQLGRIAAVSELPANGEFVKLAKRATQLIDDGVKGPAKPRPAEWAKLVVPEYFLAALRRNKKALATFEGFSYSHKKEYVEWIVDAKTEDTRERRIATAMEWIAEGKSRNWKYQRK